MHLSITAVFHSVSRNITVPNCVLSEVHCMRYCVKTIARLPCSLLFTWISLFLNLIALRSIPSCIRFHLSFKNAALLALSSLDMSGFIEMGFCNWLLLDSTYMTSNVHRNLTRIDRPIGEVLEAENLPIVYRNL